LPGWADAEALRRDADAVFKLVGEAHAALASAEKRREFDAADRKARFANEYASSFGASAPSDFGFSTFARDAARHGSSRRGGSAGGGSASRGGYRRAGGAHGSGGGGSFYGDWFGEENRAAGRGAYRSRRSGGGGYKT
jgi:curved DNA-binding protein CbpA